jgi:aspartate aminotransferase
MGPTNIIDKMKGILSHIGAWSPMAEQVATAKYLQNPIDVNQHLQTIGKALSYRLETLYKGFMDMKAEGFPVDAIAPKASMYLTIRFSLKGKTQPNNSIIQTTEDMTAYLLSEASLAIVPFAAFGADKTSEWYRLSVGTCKIEDIDAMLTQLRQALSKLK